MIDCHCHLEQHDYDNDRDQVIEKCKQQLKAVITCCSLPKDFDLTMELVERYKGFVFCTVGIHPGYVKNITEKEKDDFLDLVKANRDRISGIGEVGLDYAWVKEREWQEKQKEWFVELVNFAKDLNKPIVVHARDAFEDAIKILEQEDARQVLMHMFGANQLTKRVAENNWFVSTNTILLRSKKHKKIARDMPVGLLMLETDSPWLGLEGKRNDPTTVKLVAEKVAEIKKLSLEDVDKTTTDNATRFFKIV